MKLRFSPTSPYVRKVVVTAAETGLADQIELVPTNPRDPNANLGEDNPLGKVPALVTDDGVNLFDSPVICEYLDSLHGGTKLMPASGEAWFPAGESERGRALGSGVEDDWRRALAFMASCREEELLDPDLPAAVAGLPLLAGAHRIDPRLSAPRGSDRDESGRRGGHDLPVLQHRLSLRRGGARDHLFVLISPSSPGSERTLAAPWALASPAI